MVASSRRAALGGAAVPIAVALAVTGCSSSTTTTTTAATSASHSAQSSPSSSLPAAGTVSTVATSLGAVQQNETWGIGSDGTSVWVYNGDTGVLKRITAATGAVAATIQLRPGCGRGCGNLAVGNGAVWVANDVDGTITRIDPATNTVAATIHVAANAAPQVYSTPGAVWAANYFGDSYTRIDPRTNAVTTLSHHLSAEAVTYAAGSVWLCDASNSPALTALDPATGAVRKQFDVVSDGSMVFCTGVVPLGSSLYVVPDNGEAPQVVDPATGRGTATTLPGDGPFLRGLAGGTAGTWYLDGRQGAFRLDPATGRAVAQVAISGGAGIAEDEQSVWVISDSGTLYRVVPG